MAYEFVYVGIVRTATATPTTHICTHGVGVDGVVRCRGDTGREGVATATATAAGLFHRLFFVKYLQRHEHLLRGLLQSVLKFESNALEKLM